MIEKIARSHDAVLGYRVVGDVTREDYEELVPAVQAVVDEHGRARLLLDLTDFRWEKAEAWGADLRFGEHFRHVIERMAVVGDHGWEKWLARLAEPFYAQDAQFFTDQDAAWDWLAE
ncbi:STAS/SEC14 domain-containing protein [Isoptericola sediminis]|uniref:STAS/SEC14 domain-containing protein n=1 Tax=Isoptericola sediminis TaxID=2733572 RepID=A0A849K1C9_9MICO|nr:STAS/SEC14 domain-containing protein [Isoptericola sediminis]NNU26968.1 STAS/SEC14 domain-containing protein [Isoptericola sediminis]